MHVERPGRETGTCMEYIDSFLLLSEINLKKKIPITLSACHYLSFSHFVIQTWSVCNCAIFFFFFGILKQSSFGFCSQQISRDA